MPKYIYAPHTFVKDGIFYFIRHLFRRTISYLTTVHSFGFKLLRSAFFLIVLAFSFLPNTASAIVWSKNVEPVNFDPIRVIVDDNAIDGCWTNLGESQIYSEDKLKNLGYEISDENSQWTFMIFVSAKRLNNGQCYGSVDISLVRPENIGGLNGLFEVMAGGGNFISNSNANISVLNFLDSAFRELEDALL
ncbi:hypothetical protein SAMN05428995_1121 [Loktanella sp. DSM 29012]|uniref:hypothetical protein n=1 Tax=Loktanella sp. DSM 29012 TaxID=1881056 RepID=UPI0008AB63D7|nr:hypothetical protein [Loktanella sp. DSM 29012]SEQ86505.1 hypothetical protein SAMN05428995_1121 [Loktanella sp. DSM 29012]